MCASLVAVPQPTLIVVSGPPGSGKTVLAHKLARAIPCPAVSRDEIKEGMVQPHPDYVAEPGDLFTRRTFATFFDVLRLLLSAGVTVVGEAAFQDRVWRPSLESISSLAELRIVRCHAKRAVAVERLTRRGTTRRAHADDELLGTIATGQWNPESFEPISIAAPSIDVDTTAGYRPGLDAILAFIDRG